MEALNSLEPVMLRRTTLAITACGCILVSLLDTSVVAQSFPGCSQKHASRQSRAASLLKRGDARMAKSAAGHVTKYAVERYGLQNLVTEAEVKVVFDKMYAFLSWKLGTPGAVAGQWLTAGYEHFDRAYVDEAGAMLIGILDFTKKSPEIAFPPVFAQRIKAMAGAAGPQIQKLLVEYGVPDELAKLAGDRIAAELPKAAARNTVGVDLPKKYDFDNRLLLLGLEEFKKERASSPVARRGFSGGGGVLLGLGDDGEEEDTAGPVDAGAPSDTPVPVAAPDTLAEVVMKLTGLVERLDGLEARVAALEAAPMEEAAPGGDPQPAELTTTGAGYDAAVLIGHLHSVATVRVNVNGMEVGRYESHFTLDLADLLEPGKVNTVAFSVEPRGGDPSVSFRLDGRRPGKEKHTTLLQFSAVKDHLADSIDILFVKS